MPITAESKKRLPKKRKKSGSSWANLPEDILFVIFQKLGAVDILLSAQAVCRSWRRLALMPDTQVWRCIDMRYLLPAQTHLNLAMLTRVAVDRSSGNIDKLYARSLSDDDLYYISSRTAGLRCFGLISSKDVSPKVMVDFVSQCPLLQELHICACGFEKKIYRDVGQVRPELKRLLVDAVYKLEPDNRPKLDSNSDHEPDSNSISESDRDSDYESDYKSDYGSLSESDYESESDSESDRDSDYKSDYKSDYGSLSESDYESESDSDVERRPVDKDGKALEIAENMQQLHELQLAGDWMTNMGLHAILAKCLQLEYLDIRGCFNLRIFDDEVLQAKLAKIKTVRL